MILVWCWSTTERRDQHDQERSGEHPCDKNVQGILVIKKCTTPVYMREIVEALQGTEATTRRTQECGWISGSYDVVPTYWEGMHPRR